MHESGYKAISIRIYISKGHNSSKNGSKLVHDIADINLWYELWTWVCLQDPTCGNTATVIMIAEDSWK